MRKKLARTTASPTTAAMVGLIRGSGSPTRSRGCSHSVLWRLGGFFFLLLLEGAGCLANPSSPSGVNNNSPSVNIYMSVEEVKKLLESRVCEPGIQFNVLNLRNHLFPVLGLCTLTGSCYRYP